MRDLGPVLGAYHPVLAYNVQRLREISGLDEVSFHMSGTEAVMQAVRLARYHTRRTHLVRFCGAYHGWWGDVQPGVGNPVPAHETYTLKDMGDAALRVLRTRRDIACVLVNPLQALHPNAARAGRLRRWSTAARGAHFDRAAYADWLRQLRAVCTERGIVLIFDEVFVGFRLAPGGAQEYFGVRADMVTYGKTLGGGLPVGVRLRPAGADEALPRRPPGRHLLRPRHVQFASVRDGGDERVPAAAGDADDAGHSIATLDERWNDARRRLNARLRDARLPVRVANLSSIWTVCYTQPSRYNWMLQYYLRAEGLALSWVGTGPPDLQPDYTDADFDAVADRFVAAARAMQRGRLVVGRRAALTNKTIKRAILREMTAQLRRRRVLGRAMSGRSARRAAGTAAPFSRA